MPTLATPDGLALTARVDAFRGQFVVSVNLPGFGWYIVWGPGSSAAADAVIATTAAYDLE